ncbi:exonuclease 1 [Pieris napi]|uniref:exonuclease 1 n=1 Tax=Pieris napi TaxID=78633 RepID=UPI001FBB9924|nr:exonuclease 1 [Pieris napi]
MGITGLIPFIEKASRRANVSEFSGSTVAIDSYCWLHKGAFACADKLVRGEETDMHIRYCLKYVTMLLSRNIKPILVFDGRHLPAKAMTELKRRESRDISKKRAAELLSLGKIDEARSYIRRSVDITHAMALSLIKECRKRNVDCIVAPYEADSQLAYLNIKNIAQLVITEDSDLILFGCTKVLFKMDLDGTGILVETAKLPLVMKCPIEKYSFDKFRQMCIMSGCDYLSSLPGIGLAKARQFVTATQDPNFANALRKLPSFFNRSNLVVTDEYRENFLKAEATFRHQYVYNPIERNMCRLEDPDDADVELALCVNAGELLDPKTAFQLALGNLDPFTLKKMDDWDPDNRDISKDIKRSNWKEQPVSPHPSIWDPGFHNFLNQTSPWRKEKESILSLIGPRKKVVNLVTKFVPETQDQDESLSIETLSNMYCIEPANKKQRVTDSPAHDTVLTEITSTSPILENKARSFKKRLLANNSVLKKLSRFPRTFLDDDLIESKFFKSDSPGSNQSDEHSPGNNLNEDNSVQSVCVKSDLVVSSDNSDDSALGDSEQLENSQKENSPVKVRTSPILQSPRNPFSKLVQDSQDSVIDAEDFMPTTSQIHLVESPPKEANPFSQFSYTSTQTNKQTKKSTCRVSGLKKTVPNNQPTLLSKFGFQKKPVLRR